MKEVDRINSELSGFQQLKELHILYNEEAALTSLTFLLWDKAGQNQLEVMFEGVISLRFRFEEVRMYGNKFITVEDISASGWEDIRYSVRDYEEEFISFFCRGITLRLVAVRK